MKKVLKIYIYSILLYCKCRGKVFVFYEQEAGTQKTFFILLSFDFVRQVYFDFYLYQSYTLHPTNLLYNWNIDFFNLSPESATITPFFPSLNFKNRIVNQFSTCQRIPLNIFLPIFYFHRFSTVFFQVQKNLTCDWMSEFWLIRSNFFDDLRCVYFSEWNVVVWLVWRRESLEFCFNFFSHLTHFSHTLSQFQGKMKISNWKRGTTAHFWLLSAIFQFDAKVVIDIDMPHTLTE